MPKIAQRVKKECNVVMQCFTSLQETQLGFTTLNMSVDTIWQLPNNLQIIPIGHLYLFHHYYSNDKYNLGHNIITVIGGCGG